jgi:hypothetical protein
MKSHLILTNQEQRESYIINQDIQGTKENASPIHIGTNLGIARDLVTRGMLLQAYKDANPFYNTTLEIFVPSLGTIASAYEGSSKFDGLVVKLDQLAKQKGFRGNMRDIHGNVWEEKFLVISGKMWFVQYEIDSSDLPEMQANNGSLYSIKNEKELEALLDTKRNVFFGELMPGDFYYSPPGYAHGVIQATNCHYVVDIFARPNWIEFAEKIYGKDSPKIETLRKGSGAWASQANSVHNISTSK